MVTRRAIKTPPTALVSAEAADLRRLFRTQKCVTLSTQIFSVLRVFDGILQICKQFGFAFGRDHRCSTDLPSSIASESVRITPLRVDRGNIIDPEIPPRDQRLQITPFQSTFRVVVRHNITGVRGRFLPAPLEFWRREQNTCILSTYLITHTTVL